MVAPDGVGRFNRFQNGMIYWSPNTGTHAVADRILQWWSATGYEAGQYGYPTSDAVPAAEPSSLIQQFERGSIYVLSDYLRALLAPAQGFASYDTGLRPAYCPDPLNSPPTCPVDLSNYDTESDPAGTQAALNRSESRVVLAYFIAHDRNNAAAAWVHYYDNEGTLWLLAPSLVDAWTAEDRTDYPDPPGIRPPAEWVNMNREETIAAAIADADRTGESAKVVISTPWQITGGIDADHVQTLGRYSLCSTSAVIAQPGELGQHAVELRQQTHIFDVYDFNGLDDYDNPAQHASEVGLEGEKLGIAKPFLVASSSSVHSWSGVR